MFRLFMFYYWNTHTSCVIDIFRLLRQISTTDTPLALCVVGHLELFRPRFMLSLGLLCSVLFTTYAAVTDTHVRVHNGVR